MGSWRLFLVLFLISLPTLQAQARDFYVDPMSGSSTGDGSAENPWRTIQEVVEAGLIESRSWSSLPYAPSATLVASNPGAPVQPGDTLWLRSGHHGELTIEGAYNSSPVTIAAVAGQRPTLGRVIVRGASGWALRGLSISPSHAASLDGPINMVELLDHSHHGPASDIVVENCELFTEANASGWDARRWMAASSGFQVSADRVVLRGNTVRNVRFGITVSGEHGHVVSNHVENFSADGLRGLGDYGTFEYNLVQNAFVGDPPDANHDDLFQSWSSGPDGPGSGEVRGIVLRGNVLIGHVDSDHPLRSSVQGIGCFDGFFVDWVIENNLVVVDHWHGITLLGARNARIINNTVVDIDPSGAGPAWISIDDHKDGRPSDGVVRNNLVTALRLGGGIVEDHNITIDDLTRFFVDPVGLDFHPLPSAPTLDMGTSELAPALDLERFARPHGSAVDVGAYEWHPADAMPVDPERDAGAAPFADAGPVGAVDGGAGIPDSDASSGVADAGMADGATDPPAPRGMTGGCSAIASSDVAGGWCALLIGLLCCGRGFRRTRRRA